MFFHSDALLTVPSMHVGLPTPGRPMTQRLLPHRHSTPGTRTSSKCPPSQTSHSAWTNTDSGVIRWPRSCKTLHSTDEGIDKERFGIILDSVIRIKTCCENRDGANIAPRARCPGTIVTTCNTDESNAIAFEYASVYCKILRKHLVIRSLKIFCQMFFSSPYIRMFSAAWWRSMTQPGASFCLAPQQVHFPTSAVSTYDGRWICSNLKSPPSLPTDNLLWPWLSPQTKKNAVALRQKDCNSWTDSVHSVQTFILDRFSSVKMQVSP